MRDIARPVNIDGVDSIWHKAERLGEWIKIDAFSFPNRPRLLSYSH